jgi:type IV secretory pathway VirB4 component
MPATSTENLVPISDIREGVVIMKNGSLRMVLEVSAINFELRSNDEQVAILQSFQRFLNSADFPLQMVISSRKLIIDTYLKTVDQIAESTDNELMKIQVSEYSRFVKELSSLSNIMSKKFYVVLPFYVYETPDKTGALQALTSILKPKEIVKELTDEKLGMYKNQLLQRAELVYGGLAGLGLKIRQLEEEELKKLYYELYNPSKT